MSAGNGQRIVIIGAGLAGALLACLLSDLGYTVEVYERRADPRAKGYLGGRSINLALSVRGIAGLRAAGLERMVLDTEAIRMPGRMIHAPDGTTTFQPYSSDPKDAINSVSRGGLNLALIKAAAARPRVSFYFEHPCIDVDFAGAAVVQTPSGQTRRVEADLIVGADGAFSAVRLAMMLKTDRFEYSQTYLEHGYKELHIPARAPDGQIARGPDTERSDDARFAMEPHALHIWPRGGAMMIALPNRDGSFTCTLFWPFEGEHSFANLKTDDEIRWCFAGQYPDAAPLMPALVEDFRRNPASSLVTVRCQPWHVGGRVCLVGDAAHAIVPFYGQGMNAAFEDCVVLARCLKAHGADHGAALAEYEAKRKPSADAIADMAVENFIEMRDLSGRPDFQYRKKIEQMLHRAHGDRLLPQYNLVSFSTVPYELAQRRGREMSELLRAVAGRVPRSEGGVFGTEWERAVIAAAEPMLGTISPIEPGKSLHA